METQITVIVLVLAGFLAFAGVCMYHNIRQKNIRRARIKASYGKRPDREYEYAEFEAISHYFKLRKKDGFQVDDTTWNDLDMDTIFMLLNHTWSCIGESYLYAMLRTPSNSKKELEERNLLVEYFRTHPLQRERMEFFFAGIGKTGGHSIFDSIYNLADYQRESSLIHYFSIAVVLGAAVGIVIAPQYGILALIAALFFSWGTYLSRKKKIEPYVISCTCLLEMLKAADSLKKMAEPETEGYIQKIAAARKCFNRFKRNSFFVIHGGSLKTGGSIEQSLLTYVNLTFHFDLIQFSTMVGELNKNMEAFEALTENIGMLESALAVASFRTMIKAYCIPKLQKTEAVFVKAKDIYHPMIEEAVKNSIEVERGVLLTGSNASGKSTFLKTMAVNAILAQTIYTCMAEQYEGNFCKIYSSMSLKDDLTSQESYYIVEIKSLKRILDHVGEDIPLFCFVDEVLRGTNTIERIAASSQILKSMARSNVMCFAATHDIELTYILEQLYENYHFQEEVYENDILFNYQLYKGRATSRNAIKLLRIIGYEDDIIQKAELLAQQFAETGEWSL